MDEAEKELGIHWGRALWLVFFLLAGVITIVLLFLRVKYGYHLVDVKNKLLAWVNLFSGMGFILCLKLIWEKLLKGIVFKFIAKWLLNPFFWILYVLLRLCHVIVRPGHPWWPYFHAWDVFRDKCFLCFRKCWSSLIRVKER